MVTSGGAGLAWSSNDVRAWLFQHHRRGDIVLVHVLRNAERIMLDWWL
jgi:hypothetical protein